MRRNKLNIILLSLILFLGIILFILNLFVGSVTIPFRELFDLMLNPESDSTLYTIVINYRLPQAGSSPCKNWLFPETDNRNLFKQLFASFTTIRLFFAPIICQYNRHP